MNWFTNLTNQINIKKIKILNWIEIKMKRPINCILTKNYQNEKKRLFFYPEDSTIAICFFIM